MIMAMALAVVMANAVVFPVKHGTNVPEWPQAFSSPFTRKGSWSAPHVLSPGFATCTASWFHKRAPKAGPLALFLLESGGLTPELLKQMVIAPNLGAYTAAMQAYALTLTKKTPTQCAGFPPLATTTSFNQNGDDKCLDPHSREAMGSEMSKLYSAANFQVGIPCSGRVTSTCTARRSWTISLLAEPRGAAQAVFCGWSSYGSKSRSGSPT